jgi:hypothetical protein
MDLRKRDFERLNERRPGNRLLAAFSRLVEREESIFGPSRPR